MGLKTCKFCNEAKDSKEDFYPGTGYMCKECKISRETERAKEVKGLTVNLLREILDKQNMIIEKMLALEVDVDKIRKKIKKIT